MDAIKHRIWSCTEYQKRSATTVRITALKTQPSLKLGVLTVFNQIYFCIFHFTESTCIQWIPQAVLPGPGQGKSNV